MGLAAADFRALARGRTSGEREARSCVSCQLAAMWKNKPRSVRARSALGPRSVRANIVAPPGAQTSGTRPIDDRRSLRSVES